MTSLALAPLYHCADDNETLAQEITLLAGQINAGITTERYTGAVIASG